MAPEISASQIEWGVVSPGSGIIEGDLRATGNSGRLAYGSGTVDVSTETHQLLWKTYQTLCHAVAAQSDQVERKRLGYEAEVTILERKQIEQKRLATDLARLGITGPPCETT